MITDEYIIKELIKIINKYDVPVDNKKEIPEQKEKWITIKGTHILLKDGETIGSAFKRVTGESLGKGLKSNYKKKHKPSKEYSEILSKIKEGNKREITSDEIIANFIKNNKGFTEEEIKKQIAFADEYNKGIKDKKLFTYLLYSNGKGEYKRDRVEKYHEKIIKELFANKEKAKPKNGEKPKFIMLGGRGGSGKSNFGLKGHPAQVYDENYIVLDSDEIKKRLPEFRGYNAFEVHKESSDILKRALIKARKEGLNVVLDGTMSKLDGAEKKLQQFKEADYDIEMYYMHLPREKSSERAIKRFAGENKDFTGRYVPLDTLLNDMKDAEENFDKLKHYASKWAFYNNDVKEGEPPILADKSD